MKIDKPWGHEIIWSQTPWYVGKILHIKAGERLSLQYHEQKNESIRVIKGKIHLEIENEGVEGLEEDEVEMLIYEMEEGASFDIRAGMIHRMIGIEDSDVVEVSTPELDDIVRLEDKYGRI